MGFATDNPKGPNQRITRLEEEHKELSRRMTNFEGLRNYIDVIKHSLAARIDKLERRKEPESLKDLDYPGRVVKVGDIWQDELGCNWSIYSIKSWRLVKKDNQ